MIDFLVIIVALQSFMVHHRINEKEFNPNPHINFITALPTQDAMQHEEARQLLQALATQVRPIMSHGVAKRDKCTALTRIIMSAASEPIFPPEIFGCIINELFDDRKTLMECSLEIGRAHV